jgi:hypothetical protein
MSKLHRSQQTSFERARAREQRAADAGRSNLQGGTSHFLQWRGDSTPTEEEMKSAVQWNRGVEQIPHTVVRIGPRFDELLKGVPDSTETATAAGPSALHVKARDGQA